MSECDHQVPGASAYLTNHDNGDIGCCQCGVVFVPQRQLWELERAAKEVASFAKRRDERAIALEERVAKYRSRSIDRGEHASRCRICNGIWSHSREALSGEWHEADCPNKLPTE